MSPIELIVLILSIAGAIESAREIADAVKKYIHKIKRKQEAR